MIGSVVAAFAVVLLAGVVALVVAAAFRDRMSYVRHVRLVQVSTFTVFVGLWGAAVGGFFWVAS